jgi:hypothetical protein
MNENDALDRLNSLLPLASNDCPQRCANCID